MVVCGLDSVTARRWINGMLLSLLEFDADGSLQQHTMIPLIDGGTEGGIIWTQPQEGVARGKDREHNTAAKDTGSTAGDNRNTYLLFLFFLTFLILLLFPSFFSVLCLQTHVGFKGNGRVLFPGISACIECMLDLFPPQVTWASYVAARGDCGSIPVSLCQSPHV